MYFLKSTIHDSRLNHFDIIIYLQQKIAFLELDFVGLWYNVQIPYIVM